MVVLELWSDLHCPYAFLAAHRLRQVLPQFPDVEVRLRALPIEVEDEKPTPKDVLDAESPLLFLEEPDIPYRPWNAPASEWPVTFLPAFEAVKCAQRQGGAAAALDMDWRVREAFWARSQCVSMRHVLQRLAMDAGLDVLQFGADLDTGRFRRAVMEDARIGWKEMDLQLSPTFVLPSGERVENPGAPKVLLDKDMGMKLVGVQRAGPQGRDAVRDVLRRAMRTRDI